MRKQHNFNADELDIIDSKQNNPWYKCCSYTLLGTEGGCAFSFCYLQFRQVVPEIQAIGLSFLVALLTVLAVHTLKSLQYRLGNWNFIESIYWILFILAFGMFTYNVANARVTGEDLFHNFIFILSTMVMAFVGVLLLDFYPGPPIRQHKYFVLIANRNKAKKLESEVNKYKEAVSSPHLNKKLSDIVINGAKSLWTKIIKNREERERYIEDVRRDDDDDDNDSPPPHSPPPLSISIPIIKSDKGAAK